MNISYLIKLVSFSIILSLVRNSSDDSRTYKQLEIEDYHPSRVRNFYKKAVNMLSQNRLFSSVSHFGVGAFCNQDFAPNDVAMEIGGNFTISSFDSHFPYMENITKVLITHLENNMTTMEDINLVRMLLNLNWVRYVDKTNRFFRIFFNNLPKSKNSLLFWEEQDKQVLKSIVNDPNLKSELMTANNTNRDFLIEDIKKVLKKIDSGLPEKLLADHKVDEAMDIIYSRTFLVSLKGWKIIQNLTQTIETMDIHDIGFILVPGADAINYENIYSEHPDMRDSQVKFEKGKVVVKAGRHFKKGEEFTVNYNAQDTVYDIFKKYGFVPIESLYNNMIFKNDYIDMSGAPPAGKAVCVALGACMGEPSDSYFRIPKFTNRFDLAHLTIERMNHWYGAPFVEEKKFEIYNAIVSHTHSNVTEGMALSKFGNTFYGHLIYSSNFKIDIDTLISMYNQNENKVPVRKNIQEHFLDSKLKVRHESYETRERFREILKYCLINHHIVALNTKQTQAMMNSTLDNLLEEAKKEILDETNN